MRNRRQYFVVRAMVATALIASFLTALTAEPVRAVDVCGQSPDTTWTGNTSSSWTVASNWTSGVPATGADVCVPANQPFDPIISVGVTVDLNSLEVQLGGTLVVNQGHLTLDNNSSIATLTISGASGTVTTDGALVVDTNFNFNQGTVNGTGSLSTEISSNIATAATKNFAAHFINNGTLLWSNGNISAPGQTITNNGSWNATASGQSITATAFANAGTFSKSNANAITITANYTNTGQTTFTGGSTVNYTAGNLLENSNQFTVTGATLNKGSGTIDQVNGWFYLGSGGTVNATNFHVSGGWVGGIGTIVSAVSVTAGSISGGGVRGQQGGIGTLHITGTLAQSGGFLQLEIASSGYDVIAVTGAVTITGTPYISAEARNYAYSPPSNGTYNIVTYSTITGTYASLNGDLSAPPTGYYISDYGTSPLTLTTYYNPSIAGYAYTDNNGNGVQNGGDNGRSGVTVYLDTNNNNVLNGGEPSTSTDGNGYYQFTGLLVGTNYYPKVVPPNGFAQSSSAIGTVTLVSSQNLTGQNFGLYEAPTISGTVYTDNDSSLTLNGGDAGNVGMTVFFDTDNDGNLDGGERSVTSGASGVYSFTSVAAGTYKVRVVPAGRTQTTTSPVDIVVTSGVGATGINIGFAITQSIDGMVYSDVNGNGTKDGPDTVGIAGQTVYLDVDDSGTQNGGDLVSVTNTNGAFSFGGFPAGTYDVYWVSTSGYTQKSANLANIVVGASQAISGRNIGLFVDAPISGRVISDTNGNGTIESGETNGVAGINVYLDLDSGNDYDMGEPTTTSGSDGSYTLYGTSAIAYRIRVVLPGGATLTTGNPSNVTATSGVGASNVNFGLDVVGSLAGSVYTDTNGNGSKGGGENTMLQGVVVFLDTDNDGVLDGGERSTTTDSSGVYSFTELDPTTYHVAVVRPTGYFQTSSLLSPVVGIGQDVVNQLIGLYEGPIVSGAVWSDRDTDGTRDSDEITGVPNVTVYLDLNNNSLLDLNEPRVVSYANGDYELPAVVAGTHQARLILPLGATMTSALPAPVVITSGSGATGVDFGLDVLGSISGTVYIDSNDNGTRGGSENTGVSTVTLYIDSDHDGVVDIGEATAVTNGSGVYSFSGVAAGSHDVKTVAPSGSRQSSALTPSIGVTTNQDVTGRDVGLFYPPDITGTVYIDVDNSGTHDSGETGGAAGVVVFLDANTNGNLDGGEVQVTTTANGSFTFAALAGGSYTVRIVLPTSATRTSTLPSAIVVTSGSGASGVDFGLDVLGSITGIVYTDTNGNGVKDGGEAVRGGETVYIDANDNGVLDGGEVSTTTNGSGVYLLQHLVAGNYNVKSVLDDGWEQSSTALSAVALTVNQDVASQHIGWYQSSSISGTVYYDANMNGTKDAGEPGVARAIVWDDTDNDGVRDDGEAWEETDADGNYVFTDVGPGTHNIKLERGVATQTSTSPGAGSLNSGTDAIGQGFGIDRPSTGALDPMSQGTGYWMVSGDGNVYGFGSAVDLGGPASLPGAKARMVAVAPTPAGGGYWVTSEDGAVYPYGTSSFHGSAEDIDLNQPIVSMVSTSSGEGYWLLGRDGGIFSYGDAEFFGSTGSLTLNAPVVNMVATPTGKGYWLVANDGGVFSFGDALFYGSMGGQLLNAPIVGISATSTGKGYWLVANDGGVFTYGDAVFHGSAGSMHLAAPIVNIRTTASGGGYWLIGRDGGIFTYGDADFYGVPGANLTSPISN